MTPQAVSFEKEAELIAAEASRAKRQTLPAVQSAPVVSPDQIDLITRTVAQGATPDELKLYLYDCARQGVHPLDKLIHFTKRGGKYTPVTSIDFMRIRAAETGEMAGSDDAVYEPDFGHDNPKSATVTVYRLTQGVRFPYTATARWSEYKPGEDFMWRKMPHTMLAKCAEALALRKGFPRQLAGLYASEELDQAGLSNGVVEAPAPARPAFLPVSEERENTAEPPVGERGSLPPGAVLIARVDATKTKNPNVTKYLLTTSDGKTYSTIKDKVAAKARTFHQDMEPVFIEGEQTKWGLELTSLVSAGEFTNDAQEPA